MDDADFIKEHVSKMIESRIWNLTSKLSDLIKSVKEKFVKPIYYTDH